MRNPKPGTAIRILAGVLMLSACACGLAAQNAPGRPAAVRGQVTDPSGASVANAAVKLTSPVGAILTRNSDANGAFEFADLAPGNYNLEIKAAGFAPKEQAVQVAGGQVEQITLALDVATQQQEVTVNEVAPTVDPNPSNNAGAVVMASSDLDALSDDPDQLASDLQALAGPSGGPTGGPAQIFVDGFSGGTLPPKSSIREIRINQNPFTAEFDQMGFGRIEVLTKPGTDQLHGRAGVMGNSSAFNTKSPYVTAGNQTAYHSVMYDGSISGSIHRVASFAVTGFRRDIDDSAIINAIVLDPSFNPVPFTAGVGAPQTRTMLFPRLDYQVNRDNTLTASYQYARGVLENLGVGGFALPSQASTSVSTAHQLQVINSRVIGERAVNETRFQYIHNDIKQVPLSPATAIRVTGAFTGGGSPNGTVTTTTGNYELQNNTSILSGPHIFKFGGRLRAGRLISDSTNNFNGTYTFASLTAYQLTLQGQAQGLSAAQIRANGGGASQFSITAGTPRTTATTVDGGLYVQDDWKLRPTITLSGGLRFETQNGVPDHSDFAPRIGIAWSFGNKARPTVIRTGFGIFYNRFPVNNDLALNRYDGITQQQYFVTNPDFYPTIPAVGTLSGSLTSPTVYSIAPDYHSGYTQQVALTVERQLTKVANLSVNYFFAKSAHRTVQSNINAPLPGSITAANPSGTRPFPAQGNIYEYISASDYLGHYGYAQVNVRGGARFSGFVNYGLGWAHANASPGVGGFESNPYNLDQDWGQATGVYRQFANMAGTFALPYAFRLSAFVFAISGQTFNITTGQDINGDSIFNDRPAFVTSQTPSSNIVVTPYGTFDKAPAPYSNVIPINYGKGPAKATVNLTLGRTFNLIKAAPRPSGAAGGGAATAADALKGAVGGPGPAFGPRRYTLTFNVIGRNVFNKVNRGNPVGNLSSPLFGQINLLAVPPFSTGAAVRRVDLQLVFAF